MNIKLKQIVLVTLLGASSFAQASTLVELVEEQEFGAAAELLKSGLDVNQPSSDGTTALHWAAYHGNTELVQQLLRAEANPDTRNDYGSSPMMEAAIKANVDMLKLLLEAGADVESANPEG